MNGVRTALREMSASVVRGLVLLVTLAVLSLTAWGAAVAGMVIVLSPAIGVGWALLVAAGGSLFLLLMVLIVMILSDPKAPPEEDEAPDPLKTEAVRIALGALSGLSAGARLKLTLALSAAVLAGLAAFLPTRRDDR